jgi:hypothetical protein
MKGSAIARMVFLCVIILSSCSRSSRIPSGILDQDRMSALLFDISMAEGHVENAYFRDSAKSRDSILKVELDRVLLIHGVSQLEFLDSYRFYMSKPHLYKVMVDSLQARSQRDQQKMYLQPGQRRKKKSAAIPDTTKK